MAVGSNSNPPEFEFFHMSSSFVRSIIFFAAVAASFVALESSAHPPNFIKDENDQHACNLSGYNGTECDTNCTGMVRWWVSEPYISLWLEDEPLGYQPSRGPRVSFRLSFKQRNTRPADQFGFSFGGWECSWMSSVGFDSFSVSGTNVSYSAVVYLAGGGMQRYSVTNQAINYYSQARFNPLISGTSLVGAELVYPDGAKDLYELAATGTHNSNFYLSKKVDTLGNATQFNYGYDSIGRPRLTSVTDVDGRVTTLNYWPLGNTNRVMSVNDPFGRTATLWYTTTPGGRDYLSTITDTETNHSTICYQTSPIWPCSDNIINDAPVTQIGTPYGNTYFYYGGTSSDQFLGTGGYARYLRVVDAAGGDHIYMYREETLGLGFADVQQTNSPLGTLDTDELEHRNSFYWGPRQAASLSTNIHEFLNSLDYRKGRMRHWLQLGNVASNHVSGTLAMEQAPSLDTAGWVPGQRTWFDHAGKTNASTEGTSGLPDVVLHENPNGSIYYTQYRRNELGFPTNVVETWNTEFNATPQLRTHTFVYANNGIDLVEHIGPSGEQLAVIGYNDRHQITVFTNAVGERISITYNGLYQSQQISFPNGVTRVFSYYSFGAFSNWLAGIEDTPIGSGHLISYGTNGMPDTWSDSRGLVLTNLVWDKLQRLRSAGFPDGTYISNKYSGMNLTGQRDRLGNWTDFVYGENGRVEFVTNALKQGFTQLNWCECGTLESIKDPLTNTTSFQRNNQGQVTNILHPNISIKYTRDRLGRVTAVERFGQIPTFLTYTLHGLPSTAYNSTGDVFGVVYDVKDRPVRITNSVGVLVTNAFDNLDRLITRGWPNNTIESFIYSTNGLVSYTDRLGNTTRFWRDFASRTLHVTNALNPPQITSYGFNAAGDLTGITDGENQNSFFIYDEYGLVRSNINHLGSNVLRLTYDAEARLTNRWTPVFGNTGYKLNALGSVTNINYPAGTPDITLWYDAMQRLTNMVDASGTNRFTWNALGQLLTENGPWPQDTVEHRYANAQRNYLSVTQSNAALWENKFTYDKVGRLETVTNAGGLYRYRYYGGVGGGFANNLVGKLTLPNGAYVESVYTNEAQLFTRELKNSTGSELINNAYFYDDGGRRTEAYFGDKDHWSVELDEIGQLRSAAVVHDEGVQYPWEARSWTYDSAKNLQTRTKGGVTYNFNNDSLNRLTSVTRDNTMTVAGFATNNPVSVTVNGVAGTVDANWNFTVPGVPLVDGTNTFTAIATDGYQRKATNTITAYLPVTNVVAKYDANGNLTNDGKITFQYDAENRLTNFFVPAQWRTRIVYDGLGRRRIRHEYRWDSGDWDRTNTVRYIYDGMLVLQERNENNVPKVTYTRGWDLSGNFQGAGGIGGMLGMTTAVQTDNYTHYFYNCDGQGNITGIIDTNQNLVANYAYEPFGNLLSQSGSLTNLSRYRFSSKEWHPQSGAYLYEYRAYDPSSQRWLNEDPLGLAGGVNLYRFARNNSMQWVDPFGLEDAAMFDFGTDFNSDDFLRGYLDGLKTAYDSTREFLREDYGTDPDGRPMVGGTPPGGKFIAKLFEKIKGLRFCKRAGKAGTEALSKAKLGREPVLAAITKEGKVITSSDLALSHAEFVRRALGITGNLPPGVWVGTIGRLPNGKIVALNSRTFFGNQSAASETVQTVINTAFE